MLKYPLFFKESLEYGSQKYIYFYKYFFTGDKESKHPFKPNINRHLLF